MGAPTGRPRLRRGVRLTFDRVRNTHVLLFPEGVLVPNTTAAAVLELCDGTADSASIADQLGTRFRGVRAQDVVDLLDRFESRRVVEWT